MSAHNKSGSLGLIVAFMCHPYAVNFSNVSTGAVTI